MKNYEDLLQERVETLKVKLAQKQREGSLTEELSLCVRLAQLHAQLDAPKIALQFWQSCFQIAADLGDKEEEWRAAAEVSKIYAKAGQIEDAELFMKEHLTTHDPLKNSLRLSLLQAEVIEAIGKTFANRQTSHKFYLSVNEFMKYEQALKVLDEAIGLTIPTNLWWWDALAFRAELLVKLGKFEESRYSEALDTIQTVKNGTDGNVLMSLRTKSISAQIYFEMGEHGTALEFAISVIDEYKSDPQNANYRPRRRFYCEMLLLAGRALRLQKDLNFSLDNLLLAKDEAQALAVERELVDEIDRATRETLSAKDATAEAVKLQRKKAPSPQELEELADLFGIIGDFSRQGELLEKCRDVATNESTQKRLDKKLLKLNAFELRNWHGILRRFADDNDLFHNWKNLIIRGKSYEKIGRFENAESCLILALNKARGCQEGELICNSALFFLNRARGRISQASKFGEEAQTLEVITSTLDVKKTIRIDPNFSYFATRKPSNSLMKMVGSGMVMRTKTKKTSGLQLKRRRGPGKSSLGGIRRRAVQDNTNSNDDDDGSLSDFIVSDEETEQSGDESEISDESESESVTRITQISNLKSVHKPSKSLLVISSDDEDDPKTVHTNSKSIIHDIGMDHDSPMMIRKLTDSPVFLADSPLLVRTANLGESSPLIPKIDFSEKQQSSLVSNVIVRIKKGVEVLIPLSPTCTVAELMKSAQTRFERLFPKEIKEFGRISGLSLTSSTSNSLNAMLFHEDCVCLILSKNKEILQAHSFTDDNNSTVSFDSPSKFNSIEEEFKRRLQFLNHVQKDSKDTQDEVQWLKALQDRFNTAKAGQLDLSALSMDSKRLSGNNAIVNKLKTVPMNHLILRENLLVDQDLAYLNMKELRFLDLSLNFLQKPAQLKGMCPDAVDLSYNPIDFDWIISNAAYITKSSLNLIGCFNSVSFNWKELGKSLRFVKKLEISLPPFLESQISFILGLCEPSESTKLEELSLFAVDFLDSEETLVELSYLDTLKRLSFNCCSFKNEGITTICKILKRATALERLIFKENDVESGPNDISMYREFDTIITM